MGDLPKRAANKEWNRPKRSVLLAVNKAKCHSRDVESALTSDIEVQNLEFSLQVFGLALVQHFLNVFPFLCSGPVMCILCHYMLEVCDLLFYFDFYR